jgi:hypothetical protein
MILAVLLELGVACGALSLVVAKGKIFAKPHDWLASKFPFLDELLSCTWCVSHWVAMILVLIYRKSLCHSVADYIVRVFVVVMLSQVVAAIMKKCIED